MFEQQSIVAERETDVEAEVHSLESLLQPLATAPVAPSNAGFQLPRKLWIAMLGCYATFFAAIALATGGSGAARFAIIVSVLYTAMYFGLARIGACQAGPEGRSPLDEGKKLSTWTGMMDKNAVYSQVLIVPVAVALFGIAILFITLAIPVSG
ncbi:hypothetical protein EH31_11125 [Erythrobacter longus]|uniref:Uncharacterized protein n=2 Tax=Erythrobacteraceae TaxID=335929 RepID=A0A074MVS6_ERYLO|nr:MULTISPECIES: hypothetical protein [Erythrobacteraceae]KEO89702.1 hypothetical protein EH31_11125 [Erythrobacter longus]MXO91037.1 hypothetical protein [Pontixanthobacter aquaemixtae]